MRCSWAWPWTYGKSGLGVKTQIKVIVNDFFYETAGELTTFLLEKFNDKVSITKNLIVKF